MKYCIIKMDEMLINEAKSKAYNAGFIGGLALSFGIAMAIHGYKLMKEANQEIKQTEE